MNKVENRNIETQTFGMLVALCAEGTQWEDQNKTKCFVLYANEVGIEQKVNIYTQKQKSKVNVKIVHP